MFDSGKKGRTVKGEESEVKGVDEGGTGGNE